METYQYTSYGETFPVHILFDKYQNNGATAILLIGAEGSPYEGESITTATVNGEIHPGDENIVSFKSWEPGPLEFLIKEGIVTQEQLLWETAGYGLILYHGLSHKGIKLKDEQFKEKGLK